MKLKRYRLFMVMGILVCVFWAAVAAHESKASKDKTPAAQAKKNTPQNAVKTGLQWLLTRQQSNGGWGPGHTTEGEIADVGNTCIAIQAMWRSGIRPDSLEMSTQLNKGIHFVLAEIERSDEASLFVTAQRSTQLQRKLGTYVDTFIAAATLAEMRGQMGDANTNKRLVAALNKVTTKIENHQQEDGSWQNQGWAPALAQGLAAKGLNKAAQNGVTVGKDKLRRAEQYGRNQYNNETQEFDSDGSAGVELYAVASSLSTMDASVETNREEIKELEQRLPAATPAEKKQIRQSLADMRANEETHAAAQKTMIERLSDQQFIAGFGSNGGEEFLSYLQISESLHRKGGAEWKNWNDHMKRNLTRVQDADGCWRGKHCITGGTFCTATAILVLTEENSKGS